MIGLIICASSLLGCSQGMKTNTMTREEAKEFREKGHLAKAVELSKPVQVANYLWWQAHIERINAIGQNSLITILFVTELNGDVAYFRDGRPIGPYVVMGMNDGVVQVAAEAMALGAAQVMTAFVNGEYYVEGEEVRAKAEQSYNRSQERIAETYAQGEVEKAKWNSKAGPKEVTNIGLDNSNKTDVANANDVKSETASSSKSDPNVKVISDTKDYGTFTNSLEGAEVSGDFSSSANNKGQSQSTNTKVDSEVSPTIHGSKASADGKFDVKSMAEANPTTVSGANADAGASADGKQSTNVVASPKSSSESQANPVTNAKAGSTSGANAHNANANESNSNSGAAAHNNNESSNTNTNKPSANADAGSNSQSGATQHNNQKATGTGGAGGDGGNAASDSNSKSGAQSESGSNATGGNATGGNAKSGSEANSGSESNSSSDASVKTGS